MCDLDHVFSVELQADFELRIHIPFTNSHFGKIEKFSHVACTLTLSDSHSDAEICGCPLITGNPIHISYGDSVSVYSRNGAHIDIRLRNERLKNCIYTSNRSNYRSIVELHGTLNTTRWACTDASADPDFTPPRLLVVGPRFSGKNTVVTTLLNYACRDGWFPVLGDLDVCNPISGVTGCISLITWDTCCPYDELSSVSGSRHSLQFPYGFTSPRDRPELFMEFVQDSATVFFSRGKLEKKSSCAGIVINTPSGLFLEEILLIADKFRISDILVIQDDNLRVWLKEKCPMWGFSGKSEVRVRGLHISGGTIPWNLRSQTLASISYFLYGRGKVDLAPVDHLLSFESLSAYYTQQWTGNVFDKGQPVTPRDSSILQNSLCIILHRSPEKGIVTKPTAFAVGIVKEVNTEGVLIMLPNLYPIPEEILFQLCPRKSDKEKLITGFPKHEFTNNTGIRVVDLYKNDLFQSVAEHVPKVKEVRGKEKRLIELLVTRVKYAHFHS